MSPFLLRPAFAVSWPSGRSADGGLDLVALDVVPAASVHANAALWLCGKRVVGPDPEAALERVGATTIVCFQERFEVERDYPDYRAWLDVSIPDRVVWFPIPDLGAPSIEAATPVVVDLVDRLSRGERLLLHCAGGLGRAPTMATLTLMQLGLDAGDAARHIAASRPMAGPEAGCQQELIDAFARR